MNTPVTSGAIGRPKLSLPLRKHSRKVRYASCVLLLTMLSELIAPNVSYALTGGPMQPDFGSFEPVATTNMVNEFTGQFVYNIPILEIPGGNGGGYPLSLSYHSGDGPETEASWVGAGWSLNPGAISRVRRGVPDDYKNKSITYHNSMPSNWTLSATGVLGAMETFSKMGGLVGGGVSGTVRYNNYKGFGFSTSFSLGVARGLLSVGYHRNAGEGTFSVAVNPAAALSYVSEGAKSLGLSGGNNASRHTSVNMLNRASGQAMSSALSQAGTGASRYIGYLLTDMKSPYNMAPYTGTTLSGSVMLTENPMWVQIGISAGLTMGYSSQEPVSQRTVRAYGYMYSGNASIDGYDNSDTGKDVIHDYTVDRPSTYNERDRYLPVPVNTPDAYFVSGEGVGGAFRMYNDRVGIYSPNYVESPTQSTVFGVDVHIGQTLGGGGFLKAKGGDVTARGGDHLLKVKSKWEEGNGNESDFWFVPYDYTDQEHSIYESHFFRFNNDLGGDVVYDPSNTPAVPSITPTGPAIPTGMKERLGARRSGRASYIGYHTNREIKRKNSNGRRVYAYELNERIQTMAGRDDPNNVWLDDMIGEISVYNEDGNNYVYGLPVYGRGEKNLMHGITGVSGSYIVNANISENYKKVGEEYNSPYVNSYLLTQVTTPDYVDVNLNGPDTNDLGGYTRFMYGSSSSNKMSSLSAAAWYKWRIPYCGLYYHPNRLSDNTDNMGSYQTGVRETYYLDTIETKTHYAVFELKPRLDGYPAQADDVMAANGHNMLYSNPIQRVGYGNAPRCLDKIRLYAKSTKTGQPDQLIKTVRFQYEYQQWPYLLNAHPDDQTGDHSRGKLTLKRVWFEYNGVYNSAISPYEFDYTYPNDVSYPSKYQNIFDEMNSGLNQTPNYISAIDCWGNYQSDGTARRASLLCSPDQTPANDFDPAAWQLKRIILPSGGEIHIQYEQNSYAYVQNRPASVLMPLTTTDGSTNDADGDVFELNTADAGIVTPDDKQRLVDLINKTYRGKKIYYKFLYRLMGNGSPNINTCNAEYIDGYAVFNNAHINGSGNVEVEIGSELPYKVCLDYIKREVGGKIAQGDCSPSGSMSDPGPDIKGLKKLTEQFINAAKTALAAKTFTCKEISASMSYFRIPVWKKLGGGVRVKRLLMYNSGTYAGNEALFGHEYVYENEQTGESFGVATNEPIENKEENPLVDYLDGRIPQDKWDRRFDGRDKEQFEGPLSMSALPGASIGYSRVIKKNIHQDKYTGEGYTVADYYTAKDYPFDGYYPMLGVHGVQVSDINRNVPDPELDLGLFSYSVSQSMRSAQGYCFLQNQMHGQIRSITQYPGVYSAAAYYSITTPPIPVTQTTYEYFEPGEKVPMFNSDLFGIYYEQPAREMDVAIEKRFVEETSEETIYSGDFTVGITPWAPIPYAFGFPLTSSAYATTGSVVTSKVIHYPAIMKRITVSKDGIVQRKDFAAYDPLTMQPVVTNTYDGYHNEQLATSARHNGTYTDYNILASSQYRSMSQKALNERYIFYADPGTSITVGGSGSNYIAYGVNSKYMFQQGDMIALFHGSGSVAIGHVTDASNNDISFVLAGRYNTSISTGTGYQKVEVLRSGHTNQLRASMGGMTTYGDIFKKKSMAQFCLDLNDILARVQSYNRVGDYSYRDSVKLSDYDFEFYDEDYGPYNGGQHHFALKVTTVIILSTGPNGYAMKCQIPNMDQFPPAYSSVGWNPDSGPGGSYCSYYQWTGSPINSNWLWWPYVPDVGFDYKGAAYGFNFSRIWTHPIYTNITYPPHLCYYDPSGRCVQFVCRAKSPEISGVIRANVTTYADWWEYVRSSVYYYIHPRPLSPDLNVYELGMKNRWRPDSTRVYNEPAVEGSHTQSGQRNYLAAGCSKDSFKLRPWRMVFNYNPEKWMKTSSISNYTPHGQPLQEVDILGRYSTVKYGYYHTLPYLWAKNAPYSSVKFESFEMNYTGGMLEDTVVPAPGAVYKTDSWHTGRRSFQLQTTATLDFVNVADYGTGHLVRFWLKYNNPSLIPVTVSVGGTPLTVRYVTRSGKWALYEAYTSVSGNKTAPNWINVSFRANSSAVDIDDIRIQPVNAEVTTTVYDIRNYKIAATLDDHNFATFYQYNGEGRLVRKLQETERSIRTVEEVHLNTPKLRTRDGVGDDYYGN